MTSQGLLVTGQPAGAGHVGSVVRSGALAGAGAAFAAADLGRSRGSGSGIKISMTPSRLLVGTHGPSRSWGPSSVKSKLLDGRFFPRFVLVRRGDSSACLRGSFFRGRAGALVLPVGAAVVGRETIVRKVPRAGVKAILKKASLWYY